MPYWESRLLDDLVAAGLRRQEPERADLLAVLTSADERLMFVVAAAHRLRCHYFGNRIKLNYLVNLKSGLCPEDCHYCSQRLGSRSPILKYFAWLGWWLEMLRGHRAAGRSCRRARVVSEPLSDYHQWTISHAQTLLDAGEDIRYIHRPQLTEVFLPGSGDFYILDDELVLFLHYAGNGTNTTFEITEDTRTVRACADAFEDVWKLGIPVIEYRPQ